MVDTSRTAFQNVADRLKLSEDKKRALAELVLLNPDLLISHYKDSKGLASEAEESVKNGNVLVAGNRLASAAKLALYEGNSESARKYLERSISVNRNSPYESAVANFDNLSRYAAEFYKARYGNISVK
jgi:hypothetical protein